MVIQSISNSIGLSEIFRYELILTNFNSSLGNKDSMSRIVNGIQKDLDKTLKANGTQDKAILFYTGAWIESAYIAINAKKNFSNSLDTGMVSEITSQLEMLEDILITLGCSNCIGIYHTIYFFARPLGPNAVFTNKNY